MRDGHSGGLAGSGPDGGTNWLRLKDPGGHRESDTASCYGCHGNDYSGAASRNVHRPATGL